MVKFLLLSPIVFTILFPAMIAQKDPEDGMARATGWWMAFSVLFMIAMRWIYPRLL